MSGSRDGPERDREQPLIEHLVELRARLLRGLLLVFGVFIALSFFAAEIYSAVATPLLAKLPPDSTMIATEVAAPFFVPFKLCLFAALFLSIGVLGGCCCPKNACCPCDCKPCCGGVDWSKVKPTEPPAPAVDAKAAPKAQ